MAKEEVYLGAGALIGLLSWGIKGLVFKREVYLGGGGLAGSSFCGIKGLKSNCGRYMGGGAPAGPLPSSIAAWPPAAPVAAVTCDCPWLERKWQGELSGDGRGLRGIAGYRDKKFFSGSSAGELDLGDEKGFVALVVVVAAAFGCAQVVEPPRKLSGCGDGVGGIAGYRARKSVRAPSAGELKLGDEGASSSRRAVVDGPPPVENGQRGGGSIDDDDDEDDSEGSVPVEMSVSLWLCWKAPEIFSLRDRNIAGKTVCCFGLGASLGAFQILQHAVGAYGCGTHRPPLAPRETRLPREGHERLPGQGLRVLTQKRGRSMEGDRIGR